MPRLRIHASTPSSKVRNPRLNQFADPGSRNERGEYRQWLHVWGTSQNSGPIYPGVYPWPFAHSHIDASLLAAHAAVTKFSHWPGQWPLFLKHWRSWDKSLIVCAGAKLYWRLAPTLDAGDPDHCSLFTVPSNLIPEVFINALT